MIAYIPARGGSKRIPRKNIKPLDGTPVLATVVERLRSLEFLSGVYVSTDDAEIRSVAEAAGASCLEDRASNLANDEAGFIDLIHHDIERFVAAAGGDREVLFVLATAALVTPDIFQSAYDVYRQRQPGLMMSCMKYPSPPQWALVEKSDGFWTAMTPDDVLINSQDLPKTLADAGLFYFFNLDAMADQQSVKLVGRMLPYQVPVWCAVDVDEPEDWDTLERHYRQTI